MRVLQVLFLFVFAVYVSSDEGLLPEPCNVHDKDCLGRATETFLDKTAAGIKDFDILPLDPLIIPSLHYDNKAFHQKLQMRNLNVTGLRKQKIYDFQMDVLKREVVLTTKVDLQIHGDLTIERTDNSKSVSGTFTASATSLGTATYNYTFETDEKGVEHFDVGPETITCRISGELNTKLSADFAVDGEKDSISQEWRQLDKKAFCKIVKASYRTVMHNLRAAAKILPKTAFFNNI